MCGGFLTAIVTAAVGMKLLSITGSKGFGGQKITVHKKPLTKYTAFGGIVFGIGWAMSGACPGTVLAQIGEGKIFGMVTMAGAIFGTYIYAVITAKVNQLFIYNFLYVHMYLYTII